MRKLTKEEEKAVETVDQLISDYRTELEALTLVKEEYEDDCDPVMVEGETTTGYYCQMMVLPKKVANILLEYDYPIYRVCGQEAPEAMWDELAREFGLGSVSSFDL